MLKNKFIYPVYGHTEEGNWMIDMGYSFTNDKDLASIYLLGGGEDWSFHYTNQNNFHPTLSWNDARDRHEMDVIEYGLSKNKAFAGVCRGSQIGAYLADRKLGKIVQHQSNPSYIHDVKTFDGKTIPVSSTHHNCAWPHYLNKKDYKLLAWSENLLEFRFLDRNNQDLIQPEAEVVYYPFVGNGFLGLQPHWEYLHKDKQYEKSMNWIRNIFNRFVNKDL